MSLGIVAQQGNERAAALAGDIRAAFGDDAEVRIDAATAEALGTNGTPVDQLGSAALVVSIGGDGTFLFTAREVGDTPIIGVNLGEVGFLNAVAPEDAVDVIRTHYPRAVEGTLDLQRMPRLVAALEDGTLGPALNEILLHAPQRGHTHQLEVTIRVDGHRYTTETADAVMVATPTGTTAYNLSEHGPLLRPDVAALVVNVMSGREGMPALAIPLDATVELAVDGTSGAFAIADGRTRQRLALPATVAVSRSDTPVQVAGPPVEFFRALDKLDRSPRHPDDATTP